MGFKEYERNMSFLDLELSRTLGSSRTQRFLKEIHDYVRKALHNSGNGRV